MAEDKSTEEKARVTQKWVRIGATVGCLLFVLLKYGPCSSPSKKAVKESINVTLAKAEEFKSYPVFNCKKPVEYEEGQIYAYYSSLQPLEIRKMQFGGWFGLEGVWVSYSNRSFTRDDIPWDPIFIAMPLRNTKFVNGTILPSALIKVEGRYSNGDRGFKLVRWRY